MRQSYLNRLRALARSLPREHRVAVWNPAPRRYVIPNTKPEIIVTPED